MYNFNSCSKYVYAYNKINYSYEDAVAMVTIGKGKHFSLGLDLEGLISLSAPQIMEFSDELQKLLGRILTFPLVTVAAINGRQGFFFFFPQEFVCIFFFFFLASFSSKPAFFSPSYFFLKLQIAFSLAFVSKHLFSLFSTYYFTNNATFNINFSRS